MTFLLDTDICSAHVKRPAGFAHRLFQYAGGIAISTIVLGELLAWSRRFNNGKSRRQALDELLTDETILPFDQACAHVFGSIRAHALEHGRPGNEFDLLIAATALAHDLTLVTHNTADYAGIPGLKLEDWLVP